MLFDFEFTQADPLTSTPPPLSASGSGNETSSIPPWNISPLRPKPLSAKRLTGWEFPGKSKSLPDEVAPPRALDNVGRLVDLARDALRRPDLSIIHQSIPRPKSNQDIFPYGNDKTICMVENKLVDKNAAIEQLQSYANEYGHESSPLMWFFAFVVGIRGLEVAMFKFTGGSSQLAPITNEEPSANPVWYPTSSQFVHEAMVDFAIDVQTNEAWGLKWVYER